MSFENIIGNDNIKALLTNTIKNNNILHSYMFVGCDGIGKYLFATSFAKMILCNSEDSDKPCNKCHSCIEFDGYNLPDFSIIDTEDSKSIKIEQIRNMQRKITEKPVVSNKKVYIINNSDLMTKDAQNCLLKTLEEPPEYAVIILILSNENNMLNTIKSRCTKILFNSLSNNEITQYFSYNNINFKPDDNFLKLCGGSIGKAIELQNEANDYSSIDNIISLLSTKDIVDVWNNSEILYKSKDNINNLLEYMNIVFMNNLLSTNDIKYASCIEIIEKTKKRLASNANFDMCIDNLLIGLLERIDKN